MTLKPEIIQKSLDVIDKTIETYLKSFIQPFLSHHETFYGAMNKALRAVLDAYKSKIPDWFTANFVTYARTVLVIPCLLLLAWGYVILPSIIVIFVDFGDFLDGVVARFWVDVKQERKEALASKDESSNPLSATNSDDESFEIVTTGSPQALTSWSVLHRNRTYGGFVDAVCDKAFVVPCWIALLNLVPPSGYLHFLQYLTLLFLILAETASATIRFRAFFTSSGTPAPKVEGFNFSTSAVKADHVGKAKQTFEMVGTALFILPFARYFGLVLLMLALPLAYESVRRKINKRVMYVNGVADKFDHKTLKFWMQVKALGSKLVVGIPGQKTEMALNACACSCVDQVIVEAPQTVDLMFLEKLGIDYVFAAAGQTKFVTDEALGSDRCLVIGEDGIARPLKPKAEEKED